MPDIIEARWQRLGELLDHALGLTDPGERAQWLAALEQQDPDMAAQVARMLAVQAREGYSEFLAAPLSIPGELPATASLVGRVVGPYLLEAEIGRGGMASVWRARRADGRVSGFVTIKFLHAAWLGRDGETRFRQEGNLFARLDHPNIARLIDAGILDDIYPYLVIEYVDGLPIDEYCEREHLGIEARLQLFQATLSAVAHVHSHLIVHRDIKPSNVFVTFGGIIKLLDFGIAKLLDDGDDSAPRTKTSLRALTPQYAAPEQLLGQPVTTQTDVYALGLVLYLLLIEQRDQRLGDAGVDYAVAIIHLHGAEFLAGHMRRQRTEHIEHRQCMQRRSVHIHAERRRNDAVFGERDDAGARDDLVLAVGPLGIERCLWLPRRNRLRELPRFRRCSEYADRPLDLHGQQFPCDLRFDHGHHGERDERTDGRDPGQSRRERALHESMPGHEWARHERHHGTATQRAAVQRAHAVDLGGRQLRLTGASFACT